MTETLLGEFVYLSGICLLVKKDKFGWYMHAITDCADNGSVFSGITSDPHGWVSELLGKVISDVGIFPYVETEEDLARVINALAKAAVERSNIEQEFCAKLTAKILNKNSDI